MYPRRAYVLNIPYFHLLCCFLCTLTIMSCVCIYHGFCVATTCTSAFSPSKTLASSSQYITSFMSVTSTSTSLPLTTRLVLPSSPTNILPSGMDFTSANVSPSTATSDGRLCCHNYSLFRFTSVYKVMCERTPIVAPN